MIKHSFPLTMEDGGDFLREWEGTSTLYRRMNWMPMWEKKGPSNPRVKMSDQEMMIQDRTKRRQCSVCKSGIYYCNLELSKLPWPSVLVRWWTCKADNIANNWSTDSKHRNPSHCDRIFLSVVFCCQSPVILVYWAFIENCVRNCVNGMLPSYGSTNHFRVKYKIPIFN